MERNKTIARVMLTAKGLPKHAKTAKTTFGFARGPPLQSLRQCKM